MAENKTQRTTASVAAFLATIDDPQRQRDAKTLATLMRKATGETPAMWGSSIVGYGQTTYEGRTGSVDWFPVGFAPRKAALVLYLMGGLKANAALLSELGPHKVGGGCLYLRRLEEIDTKVLTRLIKLSNKGNRRATLIDNVRAALSRLPRVAERKMFGGTTFMVNGKMCISVGRNRLMCRIDPQLHGKVVARSGVRTVKMGGRAYRGFVHVREDAIRSKRDLDYWVGLCLDFNKRAKSSRGA